MKIFENNICKIKIEECIISITYKKGVDVALEDASVISENILKNLSSDKTYAVLNDVRLMKNMTREARDYLGERGSAKFNAIVLNSSVQRILAKMYFNFSNPVITSKVFSKTEVAEKWLTEQLKNLK